MKRQDVLSILITFTVGFLAGGYLYLTHFSKLVSPDSVGSQEEISEFKIVSEAYGRCGDSCPSFQILNDGGYRYQYVPEVGAEKQFKTGTIPFTITRDIKNAIDVDDLVQQSQTVEPGDCNSLNDGIDVSYTITYEGAEYTLDSCGTAVDGNSELWKSLLETWNYFQTVQ
jgi:hypothetical protein